MDAAGIAAALAHLRKVTGGFVPRVGVICGSGLSGLSKCLEEAQVVAYEDIPGFPRTTVAGHHGELVFGRVGACKVVLMRGRFHSYEGHSMQTVTAPVKLMRALGAELLVVTNAAGGLNRSYAVGDLMVISDHIGLPLLAGKHPLVGLNDDTFGGPRFLPVSDAYDPALRQLVVESAAELGLDFVHRGGCYCFVSGPAYESAGESRMLLQLGGDSVGMSTVPEIIVARHCGMKVLGLSLITNSVRLPGDEGPAASHEEVLETVAMRSAQLEQLVRKVLGLLEPAQWAKLEPRLARDCAQGDAKAAAASAKSLRDQVLAMDISSMTPLQALVALNDLKQAALQGAK
jgi:purine-nucleoside phosphorylase